MLNERIPRGNTLNRSPPRVGSAGNLVNLGDEDQQHHAAPDSSLNSDMDPIITAAFDQREMPTTNLAQEIVISNTVKHVPLRLLEEGMDMPRNYNVKWVIRIHKLDQWFKGTFRYWPANPKEPVLVDIRKASQVLKFI
uniref:Uncharacterized protein n=1 Tax=Romanomermis culicivorax TaxID=13658 RepID=A0A915KVB2_ROMCU